MIEDIIDDLPEALGISPLQKQGKPRNLDNFKLIQS